MIKKHPSVGDSNFDILIDIAIRRRAHRLRVKKTILQFIFLDLYPGRYYVAFSKGTKLRKVP
jgi:predicted transcriptional regulator with HTH domain